MKSFYTILFCALLFSSCHKDVEIITTTGSPIPVSNVEASLIGIVLDDKNQPVSGANVTIRGQSLQTDAQGFFSLSDELLNENGVYVSISKTGFFTTGKFVLPQLGNLSQVSFKLHPVSPISFLSNEDFNSQHQGASIHVPSGGFAKTDGSTASGFIQANVQYFLPIENSVCDAPGDLRGIDKFGQNKMVESQGIIHCSFNAGSMESLVFKPGHGARLRIPVNALSAPAGNLGQEIPVWKLDPLTGFWHENLKAQLVPDKSAYEIMVPEAGYWSFGAATDMVRIRGKLVDANGNGVSNLGMTILNSDKSFCSFIATDNSGSYSVFVPSKEEMVIDVNSGCGNTFGAINIGSFEQSSIVPNKIIMQNKVGKLYGKFIDCENLPVEGGMISVFQDTTWIGSGISDQAGNFALNLLACPSPTALKYRLWDPESKSYTPFNVMPSFSSDMNIGTQLLCEKIDQFIRIQYGTESVMLSNSAYMVNDFSNNQIEIQYPGGTDNFQLNAIAGSGGGYTMPFTMQEIGISITSGPSFDLLCSFCPACECNSNDQLESFLVKGLDQHCSGRLTSFVGGTEQKTLTILYKVRRDK